MTKHADRFYAVVRRIPRGRVATYGQIAALAGLPNHARHVGNALSELPEAIAVDPSLKDLPWHRVVNASGGISPRFDLNDQRRQRERLEAEGVVVSDSDRVSLKRYQWRQPAES
ncbi:MAG: MGMT family protein [Planctomycetota bacterium]